MVPSILPILMFNKEHYTIFRFLYNKDREQFETELEETGGIPEPHNGQHLMHRLADFPACGY